jgi:two-component system sensor histidine kinase VicK
MRTVFDNLIGNAIKYSPNRATVEVRIASEGDCALVSVQDNGPGVPPEELDDIFTGFQKTRARAASAERDTGLGLAIAKQIVDQHGGRIWAESRVGMGATFEVSLSTGPTPESGLPPNNLKRGALRFINHPS